MDEHFADDFSRVMRLADLAARSWNHVYLGTEHILLGLLDSSDTRGCQLLKNSGIDLDGVRSKMELLILPGPEWPLEDEVLPLTPRAKRVIACARDQARQVNCDLIDTGHLLLGLLRDQENVAALVLADFGLTARTARKLFSE